MDSYVGYPLFISTRPGRAFKLAKELKKGHSMPGTMIIPCMQRMALLSGCLRHIGRMLHVIRAKGRTSQASRRTEVRKSGYEL